ncbi:hypothetical protein CLOM_g16417 [Closterium sp. NIES-68]|nr:hypothetical protein CLOM_g16417 [Closterium sp. NIES-68]
MKSLEVSFRLALWKEEHCQANQSALRWTNQMLRHDVSHLRAKLEACGTTSPLDSVGSFPVPSAERCAQRCCAGGAERAEAGRNVTVAGEEVWLSEEEEERLVPAAPHVEDCESLARDVRLALVAQRLEEREREKVRRERAREGEGRGDTESEVAGPVQEEERQLRKEEQARLIRQEGRERSLEHEEEERQLEQEEQARSLEHEALRRQVEERMRSGWGEPGGGGGGRMDGSSTGRAAHGRQQEDCSRAVPALGGRSRRGQSGHDPPRAAGHLGAAAPHGLRPPLSQVSCGGRAEEGPWKVPGRGRAGVHRGLWSCYFVPETSPECRQQALQLLHSTHPSHASPTLASPLGNGSLVVVAAVLLLGIMRVTAAGGIGVRGG